MEKGREGGRGQRGRRPLASSTISLSSALSLQLSDFTYRSESWVRVTAKKVNHSIALIRLGLETYLKIDPSIYTAVYTCDKHTEIVPLVYY